MSKRRWVKRLGFSEIAKVKNLVPAICPICETKYIPTKKWKDKCGLCANGRMRQTQLVNRKSP